MARITGPIQAWVCDLTYLLTESDCVYLALVTDLYSRRIMGDDLSVSLSLEGTVRVVPDDHYPDPGTPWPG